MITIISPSDNKLSDYCVNIEGYYRDMYKLNSYKLTCSCGVKGSCIKYGFHKRTLMVDNDCIKVRLQRIYCKHCKKTHTIMPKFIIPYEKQPFTYVLDLAMEYKDKEVDKADYELVRYINIFHKWEQRIKSIGLTISDGLNKIITFCASVFKMGFMQNTKRKNCNLYEVEYSVITSPT